MTLNKSPFRWALPIIAFLLCIGNAKASHIVGGEVTYQCLGNDYFKVTVAYYRDCSGILLQDSIPLEIYDGLGSQVGSYWLNKGVSSFINVNQVGCGSPTPNICIETADYVLDSVHLPASPLGYTLFHQQCCRNSGVNNVSNAWKVGATIPAWVYNVCNTSPSFNSYPPVALPANVPLNINAAATEPDGDSLFYELCIPLENKPALPPFNTVPLAGGYSAANLTGAGIPITIDPYNGMITGTITGVGKYSVGICVSEYRNGVLVGRVQRDYQFTVVQPWRVFGSIGNQTNATCGASTGSATIAAGGGTAPYTYTWAHGPSGATLNNLAPGNYTVFISDNGFCGDTVSVAIGSSPGFTASLDSVTPAACGAGNVGSATISVVGGLAPFTVHWPQGNGGLSSSNVPAGTHAVAIVDASNCTDTVIVTIASAGLNAQWDSIVNPFCNGGNTGYLQASVVNGTAPFTYAWSNSASTNNSANGLSAGAQQLIITDSLGCTDTLIQTLTDPSALSVQLDSIAHVRCNIANSGYIRVSGVNGTAPYSFSWSSSDTTSFISGANPGNYTVIITDANGCTAAANYQVNTSDSLKIQIKNNVSNTCFGQNNGSIALGITGGTKPYSFNWSHAVADSNAMGLAAGTYWVTVSDAVGCSINDTITITEPAALNMAVDSLFAAGCGLNDGYASLAIAGGVTPYQVMWSNGATGLQTATLPAGLNTAVVTDSNGCVDSISVTVPNAGGLTIQLDSVAPPTCFAGTNGYALVHIIGGLGPYKVKWSNNDTLWANTNLNSGMAWVCVIDVKGCKDSIMVAIPAADSLHIALDSLVNPTCTQPNGGSIGVAVSGGTGPYTYSWNTGGTNDTITGKTGGIYTVTVTDAQLCTRQKTFTLQAVSALGLTLQNNMSATCGMSNGSLAISVTGGTAPYQFTWSNGGVGSTLTNLAGGAYLVTVTDANLCSVSDSFWVAATAAPVLTFDTALAASCGSPNGSASVVVSGGNPPYQINWSTGATGLQLQNVNGGNYQAWVTDSLGCTDTITVNVPNAANFTAVIDSLVWPSCNIASGYARVAASGGTPPYNFNWNFGPITPDVTGLATGVYYVIVSDQSGCTDSISVTIPANDTISISLDSAYNPSCFSGANGMLSLAISGGIAPYTYNWNSGQAAATINSLTAGTYSVTVTDSVGCSNTASFTLTEPTVLGFTVNNIQNVNCYGATNGAAAIHPTGGTTPYTFSWNNASTDSTLLNVAAGWYVLNLSDANGCTFIDSLEIQQPDSVSITIDSLYASSCGSSNGYLAIVLSGGTAPYQVMWSNGDTTLSISNATMGNYTATVTDANGCTNAATFVMNQATTLAMSLDSLHHTICKNDSLGYIGLNISGGAAPVTISWNTGQNTPVISSLVGGTYIVTVSDNGGCSLTDTFHIQESDSLLVQLVNQQNISCYGNNDGQLQVQVTGGAPPYQYVWSSGSIDSLAANLFTGNHTLYVTDANGCTVTNVYPVTQPDSLSVVIDSVWAASCGRADGHVFLNVMGGTAPFQIVWNTGKTGMNMDSLSAGLYTVLITDSNGCSLSTHVNIPATAALTANATNVVAPSCFGMSDAQARAQVSGGTPPYTYYWMGGSNLDSINTLSSGVAYLVVQDARNCTDSVSFLVPVKDSVLISLDSLVNPSCFSSANGSVNLTISGGNAPYQYSWSHGDSVLSPQNLTSGTYSVLVTDLLGCTASQVFVLQAPDSLFVSSSNISNVSCNSGNDGALHLNLVGGTPPYSYSWSTSSSDSALQNLSAGNYWVLITDANGCSLQDTFTLTEPALLSATLDTVYDAFCGLNNGGASLQVVGGTAPYTVNWGNGHTGLSTDSLLAGNHFVSVTDSMGCSTTVAVDVPSGANLVVAVDSVKMPNCAGSATGYAEVSIGGGTAPYQVTWSNNYNLIYNPYFNSGAAWVYVLDAKGCADTTFFTVPARDSIEVQLDSVHHVLCYGDTSAFLEVSVTGGLPPYTFNWNNNSKGKQLQNVVAGFYQVTVTDSLGCSINETFEVTQPDSFYVIIDSLRHVSCDGNIDGAIFISASGTNTISNIITGNGKVAGNNVSQLTNGQYSIWIENQDGCRALLEFEILDQTPMAVSAYRNLSPSCIDTHDGTIELTITGGNGAPYKYAWDDGSTQGNRYDLSPGNHTVTVTDKRGCSASQTFYITPKVISFDYRVKNAPCYADGDVQVDVNVQGGVAPISLFLDETLIANGGYIKAGSYTLKVMDADSCFVTKKITVEARPEQTVFFANAFTPNGDGLNDSFEIKGAQECMIDGKMEIFTRWGSLIFSTDDPFTEFWDGTINGEPAPIGSYVYSFTAKKVKETGHFQIIR